MFRFGWIASRPDARDHKFFGTSATPDVIDLRAQCPPIYDQGNAGSCTSNAFCGAVEFERKKQGLPDIRLSRLEHYALERRKEGTLNSDAGATLRTGMQIALADGIAPESEYPYDLTKLFDLPPNRVIHDGLSNKTIQYLSVKQEENGDPIHVMNSLAAGFPVIFGFTVYDSFMSDAVTQTGDVPMPDLSTEGAQGGHAVVAVGYDKSINKFIVRNSWGESWGKDGYCFMPIPLVCDPQYADDLWTIRLVQ